MKPLLFNIKPGCLITAVGVAMTAVCQAQTIISPPNYTVTTPGGNFEFDVNNQSSGQPAQDANVDDSLNFSLPAGATYIFTLNTSAAHPVDICTNSITSAKYVGASGQALSTGSITVTIPATNFPTTLYYICNIHTFYGKITVTPPQPPPPTTITKTSVSTNIVITFTGGTNTVPLVPQFSSNLVTGAWLPVPAYTNKFGSNSDNTFSGTNTVSFGRLDAVCGPDVFLRVSQAPN